MIHVKEKSEMSAQIAMEFSRRSTDPVLQAWQKKGLSQCDAILIYLQSGYSISPALAYDLFGTLACHSRIAELRGRGHVIPCVMVSRNGKRYGQYSLERG